ncbi:MAG: hypothetical protein GC160_26550 [Acidobacteria bacterium]|nr:hypothetical protein [Acidobacteriota bacterium]
MAEDLVQSIEQTLQEFRQKTEALAHELGEQLSAVAAETARLHGEATRDSGEQATATFAQSLADATRAIRAEDSVTGIATALVEGTARFAGRSALFIHRGDQLLGFRVAGKATAEQQEAFQRLSIPINQATALGHAIDSIEATVSDGGAGQMSQQVSDLLGLGEADRVHLFPVALRDKVLAVLACDGGPREDDVEPKEPPTPAIEILVALAEAWIEAVGTRRKQNAA